MAYNVFGNPITNSTLDGMPEYEGTMITRRDRARVALNMKNAQDKDKNAREYVENLKRRWGLGVSTLCLIYNATGDMVKFVTHKDWWGHIGPGPFPAEIANGQWGAFLHVKTSGTATGSTAAVVYRGLNHDGLHCDWMASWSNPWNRNAWDNMAGTWEEKNLNKWASDRMKELLLSVASLEFSSGKAEVADVSKCVGDAFLVTVRNKKRVGYTYEFTLKVKGEWTIREEKKMVKGHLDVPEFSFGELDDLQMEVRLSEEKDLLVEDKSQICRDLKRFLQPVREKLLQFEQELKER